MSETVRLEPVAWISHVTIETLSKGKSVTAYPNRTPWLAKGLVTAEQAEAYAAAKVREALEEAAAAIEAANDSAGDFAAYDNRDMHPGEEERMQALTYAAARVRARIPQQ